MNNKNNNTIHLQQPQATFLIQVQIFYIKKMLEPKQPVTLAT